MYRQEVGQPGGYGNHYLAYPPVQQQGYSSQQQGYPPQQQPYYPPQHQGHEGYLPQHQGLGYPQQGYSPHPKAHTQLYTEQDLGVADSGADTAPGFSDYDPSYSSDSVPNADEVIVPPEGEPPQKKTKSQTPTQKFHQLQERKFAEHTGHMPNARDRWGNPQYVPNTQNLDTSQPYYVDQFGKFHPLSTDSGGNVQFPGQAAGVGHYPQQAVAGYPQQGGGYPPPPGEGYSGVGYPPAPGQMPQHHAAGPLYGGKPPPPPGTSGKFWSLPTCLISPIPASALGAGVLCMLERMPMTPQRFGTYLGLLYGFGALQCPFQHMRQGAASLSDDFLSGGTMGAVGVQTGLLQVPFVNPRQQEQLYRRFAFLRPAHFGFLAFGSMATILAALTRPYEDYFPAVNHVDLKPHLQ